MIFMQLDCRQATPACFGAIAAPLSEVCLSGKSTICTNMEFLNSRSADLQTADLQMGLQISACHWLQ